MLRSDLLLHRLNKELGDLRRSNLVPGQGGFGSGLDNDSDGMDDAVDWQGVCERRSVSRNIVGARDNCYWYWDLAYLSEWQRTKEGGLWNSVGSLARWSIGSPVAVESWCRGHHHHRPPRPHHRQLL